MLHALPSTHVLEVSRFNDRSVAHAILMFELTGEYISEDFGILMGMGGKATAWFYHIIIHHHQRMKTAMFRIVIVGKRERESCMEPSMLGIPSFTGGSVFKFHDPFFIVFCLSSKISLDSSSFNIFDLR